MEDYQLIHDWRGILRSVKVNFTFDWCNNACGFINICASSLGVRLVYQISELAIVQSAAILVIQIDTKVQQK